MTVVAIHIGTLNGEHLSPVTSVLAVADKGLEGTVNSTPPELGPAMH
jgi:hypothetical protein